MIDNCCVIDGLRRGALGDEAYDVVGDRGGPRDADEDTVGGPL